MTDAPGPMPRSTSATATTAAESVFRIQYPLVPARQPRIVALDGGAATVVTEVAASEWDSARFYTVASQDADEPQLTEVGGRTEPLSTLLDGVDAVIMVATGTGGAEAAAAIGSACFARAIMTAGIALGAVDDQTVSALRPYARILLVSHDPDDVEAILVAIRA